MCRFTQFFLWYFFAVSLVGCENSSSVESKRHHIAEGCAFSRDGMELYRLQRDGKWDSLMTACDTAFVVDSFLVYDTLYKDTLVKRYASFVYRNRVDSTFDTLTARHVADSTLENIKNGSCMRFVSCHLDSVHKEFFCHEPSMRLCTSTFSKAYVADGRVNFAQCSTRRRVLCIDDTVRVDSVIYRTATKQDTAFLNYGKNAWTTYVPWINAPLFDTAGFRAALDTLDTRHPTFAMDTLWMGYFIQWEGLPEWVTRGKLMVNGSLAYHKINRACLGVCYPSDYFEDPFFLANGLVKPLERDSVITWKLKYHYLGGRFVGSSDSLSITTLFKAGK